MNSSGQFVMVSSPLIYDLAEDINKRLVEMKMKMPHYKIEYDKFHSGEFLPHIPQTIRRQEVFLLHELQYPNPNEEIIKLLLTCNALRLASVERIILVLPFISYMRQDRKHKERVPISAKMIAELIELNRSVAQLITIDLHNEQEQGFFSIPVDNLFGWSLFSEHMLNRIGGDTNSVVVIAADNGATKRTDRLCEALGDDVPYRIYDKKRTTPNQSKILSSSGDEVAGKRAVIYEDMIDTGGTILNLGRDLKSAGATQIDIYATHGIFSKNAEEKFANEDFSIFVTDSIPRPPEYYEKNKSWLTKISIADYFAHTIFEATQRGGSISKLHSKKKVK